MDNSKQENTILIGGKPLMDYIRSITYQFENSDQSEIIIKSRGKFISKAVDVAEVAKNRFLVDKNLKTSNIAISSEEFETKEGKKITVSTIEITLSM